MAHASMFAVSDFTTAGFASATSVRFTNVGAHIVEFAVVGEAVHAPVRRANRILSVPRPIVALDRAGAVVAQRGPEVFAVERARPPAFSNRPSPSAWETCRARRHKPSHLPLTTLPFGQWMTVGKMRAALEQRVLAAAEREIAAVASSRRCHW